MAASGHYLDEAYLLTVYSRQDLTDLTDDAGLGVIGTAVLQAAIDAAEGLLHSYAGKRYSVPVDLEAHPDVTETIREKLVALIDHKLKSPPRRPAVPEGVQANYDAALRWLRDLAEGKVGLGSVPEPPASGQSGSATVGGETRRVNHTNLGWM